MYLYLASPYTHPKEKVRTQRYLQVVQAAADMIKKDYIVYSPIAHCHPIAMRHELPTDINYWRKTNMALLKPAKGLVIIPIAGWEQSKGMRWEIRKAKTFKLPVSVYQKLDADNFDLIPYRLTETYDFYY